MICYRCIILNPRAVCLFPSPRKKKRLKWWSGSDKSKFTDDKYKYISLINKI